jgi:hypothetical protein
MISSKNNKNKNINGSDFSFFGFTQNSLVSVENNTKEQNSSYLSNSWVQFIPKVASQRSLQIFKNSRDNKNIFNAQMKSINEMGREICFKSVNNSKNIFEMDKIPYRCNLDSSDELTNQKKFLPAFKFSQNLNGLINEENLKDGEDIFFTPPEEPKFPRSTNIRKSNENEKFEDPNNGSANLEFGNNQSGGFSISDNLFRLSMFILQEKANIILRLMKIISLQTVNHENICCINTTLLFLLFDYIR